MWTMTKENIPTHVLMISIFARAKFSLSPEQPLQRRISQSPADPFIRTLQHLEKNPSELGDKRVYLPSTFRLAYDIETI